MGEGDRPGADRGATDPPTGRRLSVSEAAAVLGISGDAVRSRIKRGTLSTEREGGRVFVVLGAANRPTAQAQPTTPPSEDRLYTEMYERIRYLERQVEAERQAHAEARRIIAGLVERIPAIEAPSDAPGSPETPSTGEDAGPPRPDAPGPQEGAQRPWWRRVFGG